MILEESPPEEVNVSERLPLVEIEVTLELIVRQNVSHITFDNEVDLSDCFILFEDLFLFLYVHRVYHGSDPSDKSFFFLL